MYVYQKPGTIHLCEHTYIYRYVQYKHRICTYTVHMHELYVLYTVHSSPTNVASSGSFVRAFSQSMNLSLNVPFMDQMMDSSGVFPTASRAPNKALFTISAKTSRILVVNKFACEVFGYHQSELVDVKIQTLFSEPYQSKQRALVEQHINSTGETVLLSGKVVSTVH